MPEITIIANGQKVKTQAAAGELALDVLSREDVYVPTPCGGRGACGKCKISVTTPDDLTGELKTHDELACCYHLKEEAVLEVQAVRPRYLGGWEELQPVRKGQTLTEAALDIGTTTLAAALFDATGEIVDRVTALNPQSRFGADVMSRIEACRREAKSCEDMHRLVVSEVTSLLKQLLKRQQLSKVQNLLVSGNTTMLHLFLNVNPAPLGVSPYEPVFTEAKRLSGEDIKMVLSVDGDAPLADEVYVLPSASAFIGADLVAGALEEELEDKNGPTLLIDLGTNGEMVLSVPSNGLADAVSEEEENLPAALLAVSVPAGPALEGGQMACGVGGVAGAVSHVKEFRGRLYLEMIEEEAGTESSNRNGEETALSGIGPAGTGPAGLTGSAYADLIALLLKRGMIDKSGCLKQNPFPLTGAITMGASFNPDGEGRNLYLCQEDVRAFQLARAAVRAGIDRLLEKAGLKEEDVEEVILAGGMGYFMSEESLLAAGLLPAAFEGKIRQAGNTSLLGAMKCASPQGQAQAERLAREIKTISLDDEAFEKSYLNEMNFR